MTGVIKVTEANEKLIIRYLKKINYRALLAAPFSIFIIMLFYGELSIDNLEKVASKVNSNNQTF